MPEATNAQLVEWAAGLVAKHGLAPATTGEVRERFGLSGPGA
jgi:uncharacterized protein (DUF849 family)